MMIWPADLLCYNDDRFQNLCPLMPRKPFILVSSAYSNKPGTHKV